MSVVDSHSQRSFALIGVVSGILAIPAMAVSIGLAIILIPISLLSTLVSLGITIAAVHREIPVARGWLVISLVVLLFCLGASYEFWAFASGISAGGFDI